MRWKIVTAALIVAIFSVWVWSPTLHFGFVYDDHLQIESNPQLQSLSNLASALHQPLWAQLGSEKASPYYRPLFLIELFILRSSLGFNPVFWHLCSVTLHLSVALFLFLFLFLRFTRLIPACIAACLFACNPITAEVVSWASASSESLYTLLFLCALCGLELSRRTKRPAAALSLRLWSACALTLAVCTKETAIIAVLLVIAYDYLVLPRQPYSTSGLVYLPLLLPIAAYLWVHPTFHKEASRNLAHSLATIPYIHWFAFQKLLWPAPIAEFYDLWIDQAHPPLSLAMHIVVMIGIFDAIVWIAFRSRFLAWLLWLVALPILFTAAGSFYFRDYDLIHDRYLYLSSVGVAMLIAVVLVKAENLPRIRVAAVAIAALLLCVEIWQSRIAMPQFRDDTSLFEHAVAVAPHNIVALQLSAENALKRADCATAMEAYRQAQQARPDLWKTSFFLGIGYSHCGKPMEASLAFHTATTAPDATTEETALALYEIGRMNLFQNNLDAALDALRKAASLDPASHKIQALLAQILSSKRAKH